MAYGYLDFILELEKYYYFPNIYAILLNDNRLYVKPKITNDNHKKYVALVHDINELVNKLDSNSIYQLKSFQESSLEEVPSNFHTIGRGSISNEEFSSYQFIDFLIILTRLN